MTHQELKCTPEYWIAKIQFDLFQKVEGYLKENNMTRKQLADKLGVSKGYVSQILNGDFDHKISKLVELSLAIGCRPSFSLDNFNGEIISKDIKDIISSIYSQLNDLGLNAMIYDKNNSKDESLNNIAC